MTGFNLNFQENELDRRYQLLARIGKGGMGDVFLATQKGAVDFSRLVVIKRIHDHLRQGSPEQVRMFINEASLIASLNHPHIVKIFDFCMSGDAVSIVMEYVEGETLKYVLSTCNRVDIRIPFGISAKLILSACDAMHYAHTSLSPLGNERTIIHRDLGLHNLMLDSNGYLKVIDFGIAKSSIESELTSPGLIKGTPGYMAPDLFSSEPADHRIDVYALGLCLYELATQKRAFSFERNVNLGHVITEISSRELEPPSKCQTDLPAGIDDIVFKAIHKNRDSRYQTVEAFAEDFKSIISDQLVSDGEVKKWFTTVFAQRLNERRALGAKMLDLKSDSDINGPDTDRAMESGADSVLNEEEGILSLIPDPSASTIRSTQIVIDSSSVYKIIAAMALGLIVVTVFLYFLLSPHREEAPETKQTASSETVGNLLVFSSPAGAVLFVDNKKSGVIDENGLELNVTAGKEHHVTVTKAGYQDFAVRFVGPTGGSTKRVMASLIPIDNGDTDPGNQARSSEGSAALNNKKNERVLSGRNQSGHKMAAAPRRGYKSQRGVSTSKIPAVDSDSRGIHLSTTNVNNAPINSATSAPAAPSVSGDDATPHLSTDNERKIPLPDDDDIYRTPLVDDNGGQNDIL